MEDDAAHLQRPTPLLAVNPTAAEYVHGASLCLPSPSLPFPSLPCSFSPAVSFRSATPPAVLSAANRLSFRLNDSRRRIREWIGKGLLAPARGSVGRCCVWLIATLSFRFIYFYYSTLSTSMSVLCQRQDLVKLFVFFL
jgi:hypothetical protein